MMNVQQLFTPSGIAQALHAHHKRLHENYGFAPLGGKKSLHKFAEGFGFASAEPFMAALTRLSQRMLSTTINLSLNNSKNALIYVEIELDDNEYMLRAMVDDEPAFILCTVNPDLLAPVITLHHDNDSATVFIGAYALTIELYNNCVEGSVFESKNVNTMDTNNEPTEGSDFELIDRQAFFFEQVDDIGWTPEDEEDLMDSFAEAMDSSTNKQTHNIPASVVSDDENVTILFDAVAYFESELSNGNIETVMEALEGCDFDADYPTDTIAEFFSENETKRLFDYLHSIDADNDVGYRCTINKQATYKWLQKQAFTRLKEHQERHQTSKPNPRKLLVSHLCKEAAAFIAEHRHLTEPKEFSFAANKTGLVTPFGEVIYDDQGIYDYQFSSLEDFARFIFQGDRNVPYRMSERVGELDYDGSVIFDDGVNKNIPIRQIDGDSVYSVFETINPQPYVTVVQKHNNTPVVTKHYSQANALAELKEDVAADCISLGSTNKDEIISILDIQADTDGDDMSDEEFESLINKEVAQKDVAWLEDILEFLHESASIKIMSVDF